MASRRKLEEERKRQQPQKQTSWSSWIWGSSSDSSGSSGKEEPAFTGEMTDEQRREKVENKKIEEERKGLVGCVFK